MNILMSENQGVQVGKKKQSLKKPKWHRLCFKKYLDKQGDYHSNLQTAETMWLYTNRPYNPYNNNHHNHHGQLNL